MSDEREPYDDPSFTPFVPPARDAQGPVLGEQMERLALSALFDFCKHLSTRPGILGVGASQHPGPLTDVLREFCKQRRLHIENANVEEWHELINFKPPEAPKDAGST